MIIKFSIVLFKCVTQGRKNPGLNAWGKQILILGKWK